MQNSFDPDIITYSDYYPFGWVMPGREGLSDHYRYGFNGMERDDEVKGSGNSMDFGARIYDSRVGRWLSTDAHESSYPSFSPYSFAANNPLIYVDPDGKDLFLAGDLNQAKKDIYNLVGGEENFNEYFKIIDNKIVQFNSIPTQIDADGNEVPLNYGVGVISDMATDPEDVFVLESYAENKGNSTTFGKAYEANGTTVRYPSNRQPKEYIANLDKDPIHNLAFPKKGIEKSKTYITPVLGETILDGETGEPRIVTGRMVIGNTDRFSSNDGSEKRRTSIVFHEAYELFYRVKGDNYNSAHNKAIDVEKKLDESDPNRDVGSEGEATVEKE